MGLTKAQERLVSKLRSSGSSDLGVALDVPRLNYLLALIAGDLGVLGQFPELPEDFPGLFETRDSSTQRVEGPRFRPLFERLLEDFPDADTYLRCLGKLLKARLKYERILRAQPAPTIEQVGPRGLLQYGHVSPRALAAFLFWRKWIYDIDNRAAQETGYLFEPIVANSIGGVSYGARNSPIRREGTGSGRQVDCVREDDERKEAYELKLRVTIAASGQGRWGEELSFPADCAASGYTPILVVFDSTANPKLKELVGAFRSADGEAYVGDEAWEHLEDEAGEHMGRFLEKYVRRPIEDLLENADDEMADITFSMREGQFSVHTSDDTLSVQRAADGMSPPGEPPSSEQVT